MEYSIAHYGDSFYILTNKDDATNFKLMKTPEKATSMENWKDLIPHREDVLLEDIEIFKDYLVLGERSNGLNKIRIMPWNGKGSIICRLTAKPILLIFLQIRTLIRKFCVTAISHLEPHLP